jgi:elongation factor P
MYQTSDIRKGLKLEIDDTPYTVVDFQFVKPGKGCAFTRTKIKNLITGAVLERTYKSGERLKPADVEEIEMQYLYRDGEDFMFMNLTDYDQVPVSPAVLGRSVNYLLEEMAVQILMFRNRPVAVEVPNFIEAEITSCEPGLKGNTAQGGNKPATLSTGYEVRVPLFIEQGEWVKVDTRTGDYVERVRK